ncbi:MAG: GNAT family N-acetyltransferase [Lysinibacillus sp.]
MKVKKMDEKQALDILGWRYEKPYDFYNQEDTAADRAELLNGTYSAVVDEEGQLAGFFCTGTSAQVPAGHRYGVYDETGIDMGLGLHPKRTGKGMGYAFCTFILAQIEARHPGKPVRLTVATFNRRAIRLYEKLGFVRRHAFSTDAADFITMTRN